MRPNLKRVVFLTACSIGASSRSFAQPCTGNYNQAIGDLRGVNAYSNGDPRHCTGTASGGRQCVELVKRFAGHPEWRGNAVDYFASAAARGLAAMPNGSPVPPQAGDFLGFSGYRYGHIAVVASVDPDYVTLLEQNWHNRAIYYRSLALRSEGGNWYIDSPGRFHVQGWMRSADDPTLTDIDNDGYSIAEGDCLDEGETPEGVPAATVHPGAEEVCNYTDDDCDGVTDEGFEGVGEPCFVGVGACRREGRMSCTADFRDIACSITEPWPSSLEVCDGLDNDCDGATDEGVLNACGACGPAPFEVCNGADDDCDGAVDEGSMACPAGMTSVNLCFCMDVYEASRPNATADNDAWPGYGVPDDGIPQSVAEVMPWQLVTWGGAAAACQRAGKRLCLASEWRAACEGTSGWDYPYGASYDPTICNGWEDAVSGAAPTGSLTSCVTPSGIFDLSGNVWEWVEHDLVDFTDMGRRGGSYIDDDNIFLLGCTVLPFPVTDPNCASETVTLDPGTGFPTCGNVSSNIGFRCCFGP